MNRRHSLGRSHFHRNGFQLCKRLEPFQEISEYLVQRHRTTKELHFPRFNLGQVQQFIEHSCQSLCIELDSGEIVGLLLIQWAGQFLQHVLDKAFYRCERGPQFMRDDCDEGAFQTVELLQLLDRDLKGACTVLNPPFQGLVQLIKRLLDARFCSDTPTVRANAVTAMTAMKACNINKLSFGLPRAKGPNPRSVPQIAIPTHRRMAVAVAREPSLTAIHIRIESMRKPSG